MEVQDRNGYSRQVGRVGSDGTVFDANGYDTGVKVVVPGVPIRDNSGREVPKAWIDELGRPREGIRGGFVDGYRQIR
jgi:hypothetical protein